MASSVQSDFAKLDRQTEYYVEWQFRASAFLNSKNVLGALSTVKPLEADPAFEKWCENDAIAMESIIRHLSPYALDIVKDQVTAKGTWEALRDAYTDKSPANQLHLFDRLLKLKQAETDDISLHFAKFDGIVAELRGAGVVAVADEQFLVAALLRSMRAKFSPAITAIAMQSKAYMKLDNIKNNLRNFSQFLPPAEQPYMMGKGGDRTHASLDPDYRHYSHRSKFPKYADLKNARAAGFNRRNGAGNGGCRAHMFCTFCKKSGHASRECRRLKKRHGDYSHESPMTRSANIRHSVPDHQRFESWPTYHEHVDNNFGFIGMLEVLQGKPVAKFGTQEIRFIIDSGSTHHLINNIEILSNQIKLKCPAKLKTAKHGQCLSTYITGTVNCMTNRYFKIELPQVYYSSELRFNLLSVRCLQEMKINFKVEDNVPYLYTNGKIIASGECINDSLYQFIFPKIVPENNLDNRAFAVTSDLLHKRMGHISIEKLKRLFEKGLTLHSLKVTDFKNMCETCIKIEHFQKPFIPRKTESYILPLEKVYSDICCLPTPSVDGKKYFVIFIEQYTHYTSVYLLEEKSAVLKYYEQYENKMILLLNGRGIKSLYCNSGRENYSNEFINYVNAKGTEFHHSITDIPVLNEVAERVNRTILNKSRALLIEAGLPKSFWGYAIETSAYLSNRSPTSALKFNKTPYEMIFNKKPNLLTLRIFGCVAFSKTIIANGLGERSDTSIFIGYIHNCYKLYNLKSKQIRFVTDTIFDERILYKDIIPTLVPQEDYSELVFHSDSELRPVKKENEISDYSCKKFPKKVDVSNENSKTVIDEAGLSEERNENLNTFPEDINMSGADNDQYDPDEYPIWNAYQTLYNYTG